MYRLASGDSLRTRGASLVAWRIPILYGENRPGICRVVSDNLDEHGYATLYVRYDTNADVMQENAVSERFCLGCGVSVASLKNYEKRLLCGPGRC